MRACIFNIQKFSLHDGPGIRTTVFFKGCPLRCAWCANPESLAPGIQVLWTEKSCAACGACESACGEKAIALSANRVRVNHAACTGCGRCARACPSAALSLSGSMYSLERVVEICLRDKEFYEDSNGGVTLSGGEATAQDGFAAALLRELRRHGIHSALETNGFAGKEIFQKIADAADLLLFDVKHHDEAKHREGTGVPNGPILDNLARAVKAGNEVLVRIPVVRDYNDGLEDAAAFARLLLGLGVRSVQLLPFHQMGEHKYASLGMEYGLRELAPLRGEDLEEYREAMLGEGLGDVRL